jgi:hypothetical protein
MQTPNLPAIRALRPAWNKGRIVGQKRPLKPKHVWAIRVRLELAENHRDLALFNLAIDSKLRGCDLVRMKVVDVMASGQIKERASVLQTKTQKPVRFEISEGTRASLDRWMQDPLIVGSEYLWPGPFLRTVSHLDPPVCANCSQVGCFDRLGGQRLWHTFDAPDQGHTDLQEDWQPPCGPAPVGAHEDGQHRKIPRCRARGCSCDRRGH